MLHVEMPLSSSDKNDKNVPAELLPVASAEIDFNDGEKSVHITLKGVIEGNSTSRLRQFLKDLTSFRANKWTLQMKDLMVLSNRGLRVLLQFARIIRKRGFLVEIVGIHKNIHVTLQDLNLTHEFGWTD